MSVFRRGERRLAQYYPGRRFDQKKPILILSADNGVWRSLEAHYPELELLVERLHSRGGRPAWRGQKRVLFNPVTAISPEALQLLLAREGKDDSRTVYPIVKTRYPSLRQYYVGAVELLQTTDGERHLTIYRLREADYILVRQQG